MATILVTPLAQEDLGDIWGYVAESGVERADQLLDLIYEKCQRLAEYPEMGRARHELLVDLRSFTIKNYVIFYQPTGDGIEVLRVLYGARDIHRVFDEMVSEPRDDED
ncbi:MAG TPA: type II toxin-antitoxin system RelE/ParE family toxin [Pyrinomonadaceae bacterium]